MQGIEQSRRKTHIITISLQIKAHTNRSLNKRYTAFVNDLNGPNPPPNKRYQQNALGLIASDRGAYHPTSAASHPRRAKTSPWAARDGLQRLRVGIVDDDVEQPGFNVVSPAHTAAATADVPPILFVPLVFILVIPIAVAAPPAPPPVPGLDDDAVEV
ncbi:hypothetical protein M378DRAFT_17799 [Amanita muscaria Koide BX008]|uniref:Uncharacterized protein n=1 Tax=Amanita muscaria (strain Koide BX008) TaxID=946122 RepID=A0A0C2WHK9_AMAMK|nr:hypothetical protein M378DRAFT_17799 [Amanita muscaria Koide BX008]